MLPKIQHKSLLTLILISVFTLTVFTQIIITPPGGGSGGSTIINNNFFNTTNTTGSFIQQGGQVVWIEDYDFAVSAATYFIENTQYLSSDQTVTLAAAHATLDRIDVIILDNTGTASSVAGTPAADPGEPSIDPGTQLKLGIVLVTANTTEPVGVSNEIVYFQNDGGPGEWNWTTNGSGFVTNSTTDPKAPALRSINGTTVAANAYAQGQISAGTFDVSDSSLLVLFIKSKASWLNNRGLQVGLFNAGVLVGSQVVIARSGTWGFDSSNTTDYQQIAIPISNFQVPAGELINQIRIQKFGSGANIGMFIADVYFQDGLAVANQLLPAQTLLGRGDTGQGTIQELTLGAGLAFTGTELDVVGGGGVTLDAIDAAVGANTIASGNNHSQIWNWALTSNSVAAFAFGETTAATGGTGVAQQIVAINTLATSTAVPLYIKNFGSAASFRVDDVSGDTTSFIIDLDGNVIINGDLANGFPLTVFRTGANNGWRVVNGTEIIGTFANGVGTLSNHAFNVLMNQTNKLEFHTNGIVRTLRPTVPTTISGSNTYLQIGDQERGQDDYYLIGFGFNFGAFYTQPPAYFGFQQKSGDGSHTFGDFIWGTRLVETNTLASERMRLDHQGTLILPSTTPTPAVTNTSANSCGTDAATIAGNNNVGTITVGATSGTSCTVTFTTTAPVQWVCAVNNATTANLARAVPTSTTSSIFQGTFVGGDLLNYVCFPR